MKNVLAVVIVAVVFGVLVIGAEIYIPADAPFAGTVLIAESFYKIVDDVQVPLDIAVWQGANGVRNTDWFDTHIEAHPGDVIVLDPGQYKVDVWILTPRITVTTDADAEEMADIWGTVEVDADGVILDRIAVTGARKNMSSGHGIEVNREVIDRITIRNCHIEENEWTGIHIIGPRGKISELRVEDCQLIANGMDGMDAQSVEHLIITGCTITDNGWNLEQGVGVRIGSYVISVEMHDNIIAQNRFADVYHKE